MNLPDKPKLGEPCNGCGICCVSSLCDAGEIAFPNTEPPCPGLVISDKEDITACELILIEEKTGMEPVLKMVLGIGCGCSMED